jgi:hypothetical protein
MMMLIGTQSSTNEPRRRPATVAASASEAWLLAQAGAPPACCASGINPTQAASCLLGGGPASTSFQHPILHTQVRDCEKLRRISSPSSPLPSACPVAHCCPPHRQTPGEPPSCFFWPAPCPAPRPRLHLPHPLHHSHAHSASPVLAGIAQSPLSLASALPARLTPPAPSSAASVARVATLAPLLPLPVPLCWVLPNTASAHKATSIVGLVDTFARCSHPPACCTDTAATLSQLPGSPNVLTDSSIPASQVQGTQSFPSWRHAAISITH